jgi:hypothetical protein
MSDDATSAGEIAINVWSGAGLGLLLGVIVGLSQTPVVAEVMGVLTGVLAVFLGLQGGRDADLPVVGKLRLNGARIGSFGVAAALGLILGLFLRVANPFVETPDQEFARWAKAFPDNEVLARQAMLYERTGIQPAQWYFANGVGMEVSLNTDQAKTRRAVLYSVLNRTNLCNELDPARFTNDPVAVLKAYANEAEPVLDTVAAQIRSLPEEHRLDALVTAHTLFCALQREARQEARAE